jgi:hypothetical protein
MVSRRRVPLAKAGLQTVVLIYKNPKKFAPLKHFGLLCGKRPNGTTRVVLQVRTFNGIKLISKGTFNHKFNLRRQSVPMLFWADTGI